MGNPVQAMSGLGSSEVMAMPDGRAISIHLAREGAKVGIALGFDIPKFGGETAATWADSDRGDVFESLDAGMTGGGGGRANWRSSMAQDIAKHRRSEVDFMNGYIVGKGREAGVPTPVHAAVVDTMQAVDSGEIEPSPVNITNTLKQAGLA
jgi:2-dehydropantoate 2-reductase